MKLVWDKVGEHFYEQGVQKGVLFPIDDTGKYAKGVAWNGLRTVDENPSGAEANKFYADNDVYLNILSKETYGATIGAYTYPDEWEECDGSRDIAKGVSIGQQPRRSFGLCYRTEVGNDVTSNHHYKLHIVYNCLASPSERNHETMNDSPAPSELSWTISTTPIEVSGFEKTATLEIDSSKVDAAKLKKLEDILYGTDDTTTEEGGTTTGADSRLPLPDEIAKIFAETV